MYACCLQLLQGDAIARLILMAHRQLHRARGNRHQRLSLGPLIALLSMLGDLVCTPGAFRHTLHILLQHLHVRSAFRALVSLLLPSTTVLACRLAKPQVFARIWALHPWTCP